MRNAMIGLGVAGALAVFTACSSDAADGPAPVSAGTADRDVKTIVESRDDYLQLQDEYWNELGRYPTMEDVQRLQQETRPKLVDLLERVEDSLNRVERFVTSSGCNLEGTFDEWSRCTLAVGSLDVGSKLVQDIKEGRDPRPDRQEWLESR